jgi:hypothetical protein
MSHAHIDHHQHRGLSAIVLVPAVAIALMLPAAPAQASCVPNAIGIAHSAGTALVAATDACPPANGEPAFAGAGRKVG